MGSDQLPVHDRLDEETVAMGWFEHDVEVPVEAGTATALFTDAPDRWLPPVVGIRALHEVETVSPLRIFGPARFRIHPGRLVSQHQLLRAVWGPGYEAETGYLRVHLAQIRHKLEPLPRHPRYFVTEPGMGYRFDPAPPNGPSARP